MKRILTYPIDLLRLTRPSFSVPLGFAFGLTVLYARGEQPYPPLDLIAIGTAGVMLVIAAGYMFNDAVDVSVDRNNRQNRPIAADRVSAQTAAVLAMGLLVGGLVLGAVRGGSFLMVLGTIAGLLLGYDVLSKQLGAAKPLAVGVLVTSIYLLAVAFVGGAFGPRAWSLLPFAGWMFISATAFELLADIQHRKGDATTRGWQSAIQQHPLAWRRVASWMIVAGALALLGPIGLGCGEIYAYGTIFTVIPVAVAAHVLWPIHWKKRLIHLEFVLVGLWASLDLWLIG